jgi:hypothetical protein
MCVSLVVFSLDLNLLCWLSQCELRFPKQRILAASDEEYDDSDDEDVATIAMATRATKQLLYYFTDSERFQPPKKKPRWVCGNG